MAATAMCVYVVMANSAADSFSRPVLVMAIFIAALCSVSITATVILSKTFAANKVPASVVLSIRFPLLIITCLTAVPFQQNIHVDGRTVALIFGVALVGIGASAYFLQRGVELAPAVAVSTCLALSPLVVFGIAAFRTSVDVDPVLLALIMVIVSVSLSSIIYDGRLIRGRAITASTNTSKVPSRQL
jgi:drug/metabolite transporter (DMT)-like permease